MEDGEITEDAEMGRDVKNDAEAPGGVVVGQNDNKVSDLPRSGRFGRDGNRWAPKMVLFSAFFLKKIAWDDLLLSFSNLNLFCFHTEAGF